MPSVYIKTYGCQMNVRDSEALAAQLVARGYSLAPDENTADVVLLNTCSVRDTAEQKALGKMAALVAERKRSRANIVLGFLGCMAQSRGESLLGKLPEVDLVVGTQRLHRVPEYLAALLSGQRQKVVDIAEEPGSEAYIREHLLGANGRKTVTAYVSIMQGCNLSCSFCIVPQTRGRERSRSIADIVAECRELAAHGVKEVTLLGQTVTSYGRGVVPVRDGKSPFVQLLEAIHEIEGLERIRFTAPHPRGFGPDLIEAFARLPKLCEGVHIPVQSGSNRVLKLMRRGYTREQFLDVVAALRRVRPAMGICTDFIVGFPGETDEDFEQTLELVRLVQFDQAFIFKYSPRKDTPAAAMPGQVPAHVRAERHARLLQLMNEVGGARYRACVGRRMQVLVEGPSKKNLTRLSGRTRCNKIVVFNGPETLIGELVELYITRAGTFTLYGELPDQAQRGAWSRCRKAEDSSEANGEAFSSELAESVGPR
ncbi:MAG: tRNA (N6-isopentenyl adenosine(37)-C2)-methylthiotransferase MiaB [Verrucomicrobiales bacterium]|nr:tRNA (N6-isopentenyl adenosine(37)-C2)-methylthiotransferase MiaB [Verrucomicrobiales bacterium]